MSDNKENLLSHMLDPPFPHGPHPHSTWTYFANKMLGDHVRGFADITEVYFTWPTHKRLL